MNRTISLAILILLTLALAACDEECSDDCLCPTCDTPPEATLANVWPNEDGRQWTFDFVYETSMEGIAAFADSFTIDDVDSLLALPMPLETETEYEDLWRLRFDGMVTTETGSVGQNLRAFLFENSAGSRREVPSPFTSRTQTLLERTRPFTADGLARRVQSVGGLMLGGDAAYVKTDELIGAYADVGEAGDILWKYLEANLEVGHEFRFPLLNGSQPGLWLDVRIRDVRDFELRSKVYSNTVVADYFIHYGLLEEVDVFGETTDRARVHTVGRIAYTPDVGPVYNVERFLAASESGEEGANAVTQATYWLIGSEIVDD